MTSRPCPAASARLTPPAVDRVRGRRRPEPDSPRAADRPGGATV